MTICVLLLPKSMPVTVHLCSIATSALLLLLCSSTSCFGTHYEDCLSETFLCGDIEFGYPFGEYGSGCGDPEFQLYACDYQGHPMLNMGGEPYHILESSYLANTTVQRIMNIVNDNLWGGKCNLSGNYSQFWWPGSTFQIAEGYTNITLWKHCNQVHENISGLLVHNLSLCGDDWYYSLDPHLNLAVNPFCNVFQLPIIENQRPVDNNTLLGEGFKVTWHIRPNMFRTPRNGSQESSYSEDTGGRKKSAIIIGCVAGVVLTAIALVFSIGFYAKMGKPSRCSSTSKVEKFLKEYACEMPTRYSLSQLKKITNNFAEKLGEGGYGVVYKGKIPNGVEVAVKILDRHRDSEIQFMNEVATIGRRVHHFNLVRLLGYCFEGITGALVYEFMVNGSLDKFLFARKEEEQILGWEQLYSVALGAARGIAYLHQDCEKRIIHFDIKPHNVLLDADFTPKVSDFGLAKLCGKGDDHISMTAARGTPGYVAPELCDSDLGPVTDKSDVYSFGMLLLEIVGGRKNIDWKVSRSSQFYFPEWAFKLLERGELGLRLREGEMEAEDEDKAKRLTKVGLWCIQYNSRDRPCMSKVVQMLEGNGDNMTDPPLPFNISSLAEPENPLSSAAEDSFPIEIRV